MITFSHYFYRKGTTFAVAFSFFILILAGCDSPISPNTSSDRITSKQQVMQLAQKYGLDIEITKEADNLKGVGNEITSVSKLKKAFAKLSKLKKTIKKKGAPTTNSVNKKMPNKASNVNVAAGIGDPPAMGGTYRMNIRIYNLTWLNAIVNWDGHSIRIRSFTTGTSIYSYTQVMGTGNLTRNTIHFTVMGRLWIDTPIGHVDARSLTARGRIYTDRDWSRGKMWLVNISS